MGDVSVPDRLPPHSVEAEQGVLGCILLDPPTCLREAMDRLKDGPESFYDLRHQIIYEALLAMRAKGDAIDLITLQQQLKDNQQLEAVGGIAYLISLSDAVPSAANLKYYADIVIEKHRLRQVIRACTEVVADSYEAIDGGEFLAAAQRRLVSTFHHTANGASELSWPMDGLMAFDTTRDPNAIVGLSPNGQTTRYLCRGYGAWLIGQSGTGKSSLIVQMAICFALQRAFFGMWAVRKLRVLIVQAENDEGDAAEELQGIARALGIDVFSDEFAEIRERVKFVTERRTVGAKFCSWLERQISLHRADVVFVDPFLSFAGIDVSRQDQCSQFLRTHLNPVLADTGAVLIASHHTGKPKDQRQKAGWTAYDFAYDGIGSSELVNWARAVMLLQAVEEGVFKLLLAKRGRRAGATNPDGSPTAVLWLRHAQQGIAWEQVAEPEETPDDGQGKAQGGRPSKVDELMALGLGPVLDKLTAPVGKNALAKLIEDYAASKGFDAGASTFKRAVELLVKNKALRKAEGGYSKA